MLIAALQSSEWPQALREMHRVLRPGGWLQLGEAGKWHAGPQDARLASLVRALFVSRGLLLDVALDLPRLVTEAGFVDVTVEKRMIQLGRWAGPQGRDASDNFLGVFAGMKTPVLRSGGLGIVSSEEEFDGGEHDFLETPRGPEVHPERDIERDEVEAEESGHRPSAERDERDARHHGRKAAQRHDRAKGLRV